MIGGLFSGVGSIAGGLLNAGMQSTINERNYQMQKEFAQNGIQWKVADAEKAGVHKLAALGAQTYQATPSSVAPDIGGAVSNASKHFGQAIDDFIEDKSTERQLQLDNMRLQNMKLENEIKDSMGQGLGGKKTTFDSREGTGSGLGNPENYFTPFKTPEGDYIMKPNQQLQELISENKLEAFDFWWKSMTSGDMQEKRLMEWLKSQNAISDNERIFKFLSPNGWIFRIAPKDMSWYKVFSDYDPSTRKKGTGKKGTGDSEKGDKILKMVIEK